MVKVRQKTKHQRRKERIKQAIKDKGRGRKVVVSRSNRYLSAQVVDVLSGETMITMSDQDLIKKDKKLKEKTKTERAYELGRQFAKKMITNKIKKAAFDRSGYLYHGRVKAFVEGLRKGGVKI